MRFLHKDKSLLDGYLGNTLEWTFANDAERKAFRRSQWTRLSWLMNFFLLPIAFVMVGIMLSVFSVWAVGSFVAFMFFYGLERLIVTGGKRLTGLKLRLHPGFFILTEYYGRNSWWRDRGLGKFSARAIKSAGWTGEGCFIELDRRRAPINHVVLPSGFFRTPESIGAMERWAEVHGVVIEGVPPLPGGYVRESP